MTQLEQALVSMGLGSISFKGYLSDLPRCPGCGTAFPTMSREWMSKAPLIGANDALGRFWAVYRCTSCGNAVLAKGKKQHGNQSPEIEAVIPRARSAHEDLPEPARIYLQQAMDVLHAPDAAAVMAGSAVDTMLKVLGYEGGSVYARIGKAVAEHKLTANMGDWANEVRLGSNRPRHADAERPHVTEAEARSSVDFAEALGYFLFVLTKQVERGTIAAKSPAGTGVVRRKIAAKKISSAAPPIKPIRSP